MDQDSSKSATTGQPSDQQKVQPHTSKYRDGERELVRPLSKNNSGSSSGDCSSIGLFKKQFEDGDSKIGKSGHRRTREQADRFSPAASTTSTAKDVASSMKSPSASFFHFHNHDNNNNNNGNNNGHNNGNNNGNNNSSETNNDNHHHIYRHHHSLANLLPGSNSRLHIDRSSPSPPIPHPSSQQSIISGAHEATTMNRSASTPYQQHQHQHHFLHQSPNKDSPPPAPSITSATTSTTAGNAVKNSGKKLFNFTKKATRLAGEIALGRYEDDPPNFQYHSHPHLHHGLHHGSHPSSSSSLTSLTYAPQFHPQVQRQKYQKQQLSIEYHAKMKNVMTLARNHSMSFYIGYLRFFLKYMDDSELDDPFLYSITRNSFWNTWYIKYLNSISETLDARSTSFERQQQLEHDDEKSNADSLLSEPYKNGSFSDSNLKSRATSVSSAASSQSASSSVDDIKTKLSEIPSTDEIDSEIFQDRRTVLLLLWHNQIINRLSNHSSIIHGILSSHPHNSEMCIITSNRLKPYQTTPNNSFSKLMKNHISPARLELIDGWQLRHDFPNYRTNLVNLSDRFQVLLDLKKSGYLPIDLQQQYPHFNDYVFLTDDFLNAKLQPKEREFLSEYSSFTAPSIHKLPFADESQSLVYTPDFTRLIFSENDVKAGLTEFNRILKPGGSVFLILYDVLSFKNSHNVNMEHGVRLGEYIQIFINNEISKLSKLPNLSQIIIKLLKLKNYQKIKYVKLGIPVINYNQRQNQQAENNDHTSSKAPNMDAKDSSTESDNLVPQPTAGEEKEQCQGLAKKAINTGNDLSRGSEKVLEQPDQKMKNAPHFFMNSKTQRSETPGSLADSPAQNLHQARQSRHSRHTRRSKSSSRTRSPNVGNEGGSRQHRYREENNDDSYSFSSNKKENLGDISDQPIASLYCMLSSYIDFLRMSQVVDLHSWISDPEHGHVRNSGSFSGVASLTEATVQTLRLWLDWKLHGFDGSLVRERICERIKDGCIDKEGHDSELGVKLKIHDIGNSEKRLNPILFFDDVSLDVFNDGILAGLSSIMLITAEKGKV